MIPETEGRALSAKLTHLGVTLRVSQAGQFWADEGDRRREVWVMRVDRFSTLLYGIGEGAAYLAVPSSTLASWAYGYRRHVHGGGTSTTKPVITAVRPEHRDEAAMPFIGLGEAYALATTTPSMQAILPRENQRANWLWSVTASGCSPK